VNGVIDRVVRFFRGLALVLALGCLATPSPAQTPSDVPASQAAASLVVYVRDGCPHCADAKVFLEQLARERPHLRIVIRR
jgi:hypothetical protein